MGRWAVFLLAAFLAGCATTGERDPKDPWEGFNRKSFAFNEKLDAAVLKPVATGYVKVVPAFAREGVNNFFDNLDDVGTGLNNFLQGKPRQGASDLGRFAVNTVLGVFGLWDIATPLGLEKHYEDFGQTLGVWGSGPGPYLVLPLLPPLTVRDGFGYAVDSATSPLCYFLGFWDCFGMAVGNTINDRSLNLDLFQGIEESTVDLYSSVRNGYLQRRNRLIKEGK